jgi:hypothetical protein
MRGRKALYDDLIPSSLELTGQKSQRNMFLEERDEAMCCRFYYHAHLCRRRYDDCLTELSREFFLSPNVITQRLIRKDASIRELISRQIPPAELRKRYPYFVWTK